MVGALAAAVTSVGDGDPCSTCARCWEAPGGQQGAGGTDCSGSRDCSGLQSRTNRFDLYFSRTKQSRPSQAELHHRAVVCLSGWHWQSCCSLPAPSLTVNFCFGPRSQGARGVPEHGPARGPCAGSEGREAAALVDVSSPFLGVPIAGTRGVPNNNNALTRTSAWICFPVPCLEGHNYFS